MTYSEYAKEKEKTDRLRQEGVGGFKIGIGGLSLIYSVATVELLPFFFGLYCIGDGVKNVYHL